VTDLPPELRRSEGAAQQTTDWEQALRNWADQELARFRDGTSAPLLDSAVPRFEQILIETALKHTGGRRRDASELLGWGRNTLTRKIKELGMAAAEDADGDAGNENDETD